MKAKKIPSGEDSHKKKNGIEHPHIKRKNKRNYKISGIKYGDESTDKKRNNKPGDGWTDGKG